MPLSNSEATASDFLICGPHIVFLAPTCNHDERTDCADCAANAARKRQRVRQCRAWQLRAPFIVAPARQREADLCSARPCATPFRLSGKNDTYFEELKEEESNLKHFQMSDCSHFAVLDYQITRPCLLWAIDAGLHPGRPPGQTPGRPPSQLPNQRKEICEQNNGNYYFISRNNSK